VLTSITGLEFAYAEAPASLKSVVMAFFLITVAIGNLLVMVSGEFDVCGESCNYFLFAGLMVVAFIWFAIAAWLYARSIAASATGGAPYAQLGQSPSVSGGMLLSGDEATDEATSLGGGEAGAGVSPARPRSRGTGEKEVEVS
jgi:hypothetical protein